MKAGRQTAAWKADSKEPVEEGRIADLLIRHSHSRSVPAGFLQYPEPCQRPDEIVRDKEGCIVRGSEWMTYEMRLMAERFVSDGMIPRPAMSTNAINPANLSMPICSFMALLNRTRWLLSMYSDGLISWQPSQALKEIDMTEIMKAVRLHEFGGPEVLRYENAPRPAAGAGEVLVRVHAASLNPPDLYLRDGYRALPPEWQSDPSFPPTKSTQWYVFRMT